jgi:hypothetical protein
MPRLAVAVLLSFVMACLACSRPEPPPTDEPPEPQAATAAGEHTELRDAIRQPIEKAKAVEAAVQEAADKQRAEIDAQTGG